MKTVLRPIVDGLSRLGCPFQGVLYAGLMMVRGRPYVLEFNARFGDPETQVVVPLLRRIFWTSSRPWWSIAWIKST